MAEYIERSYIRKMAMFETAYTMETETDAAVLLRMVEDAPTADVAPVVRCKDCKHHYDCGVHFCNRLGMDCPDDSDFFCSYGERKDDIGN